MKRPTNKEIKAAVDKLKDKTVGESRFNEPATGQLSDKKSSLRIRKQGV
ncbi:MAG: hypothetical protein KIS66_01315 [Fimbriimonadaceae bacterium]|nr:hypothetical protein [Fimbriimonadaceae bacterium]